MEWKTSNDSERSFDAHKNFNERKPHQKIKRYFPGILVIVQSVVEPKLVITILSINFWEYCCYQIYFSNIEISVT